MEIIPVKSMLFWFSAIAAVLPLLLALVSALYYGGKQRSIRKRLGTHKDSRTKELHKLIEELSARESEKQAYRKLLNNELMSVQEYIKTRVDPTIVGYNSSAAASAVFYTGLTILQIVYAVMIPLVLLAPDPAGHAKLIGAVLGALVTAACTINATCRFKARWVQYLGLRDRLFAERSLYMASGVYRKDLWRRRNGYDYNFVELCENIIALEYRNLSDKLDIPDGLEAEPIEFPDAPAYDDTVEGC